jgi:hypothetical protein
MTEASDPTTKRSNSLLRRMLGLGVLAGVGYAVWRAIEANRAESDSGWRAQPFPFPPEPNAGPARNHGDELEVEGD